MEVGHDGEGRRWIVRDPHDLWITISSCQDTSFEPLRRVSYAHDSNAYRDFLDCFVKDESVSQERRYAMLDKSFEKMLSPNVQPFFAELLTLTTSLEIRQAEIHEKFRSIRILSKRSNLFQTLESRLGFELGNTLACLKTRLLVVPWHTRRLRSFSSSFLSARVACSFNEMKDKFGQRFHS